MINQDDYLLRKSVTGEMLVKAGFIEKGNSYILRRTLYLFDDTNNPAIYLKIGILLSKTEPIFVQSILSSDSITYPPFYNEKQQHDNLVYDIVEKNYIDTMDKLVKNKILKRKRNSNGRKGQSEHKEII